MPVFHERNFRSQDILDKLGRRAVNGQLDAFAHELVRYVRSLIFKGKNAFTTRHGREVDQLLDYAGGGRGLLDKAIFDRLENRQHIGEREVDECRGNGAADHKNHGGVIDKDADIATHEDGDRNERYAGYETNYGCNVHTVHLL